jgi:large subunit ribosomal protein L17
MRHRNHSTRLNRTSEHRLALMRNLSVALVEHERIHTTAVKARQIRPFLEPLITRAKKGDLASKRLVLSRLQNRAACVKLFDDIAPRVNERDGGYLRIIKDGPRMGDGAPMAYIEFVDPRPEGTAEAPRKAKTLKQRLHERRKEMRKLRAK